MQRDALGEGSPQPSDTDPWGCPGNGSVFCSRGQILLGRACLQVPPLLQKDHPAPSHHCKSVSQLAEGILLPKDIIKDSRQAPGQVIAQGHSQRHCLKLTLLFSQKVSLQLGKVTTALSYANKQGLITQRVYLKHV